jgi:hypothetical protein
LKSRSPGRSLSFSLWSQAFAGFHEDHVQFVQNVFEQRVFILLKIPLGFLLQDLEQVDRALRIGQVRRNPFSGRSLE